MNPENNRYITLVSSLGKLFTAVLNERLNLFLTENDILSENQAGFRIKIFDERSYLCSTISF